MGKVDPKQIGNAVHTFTDASFGVVYRSLRSISGVIVYLFGTPIAWRSKVQSVFSSSTCQSEWIAMCEGIELEDSILGLVDFVLGKQPNGNAGPIWCDNRSAVMSARKGPNCTDEIPKRTRHVALRFAQVLPHAGRLWFCPTNEQLADGLTKSNNPAALRSIVHCKAGYPTTEEYEVDEDEFAGYVAIPVAF